MWTRSLLKTNAKQVLRQNYWMALLVSFVAAILGAGGGGNINFNYNYNIGSDYYNYSSDMYYPFYSDVLQIFATVLPIVSIFLFLLKIFVSNPVSVGSNRYFMESRVGNAPFSSLFSAFGNPAYWNVVKVMFLRDLFVFLWSLLLIFPGIYKAYQYRMVDYLLAENPYLTYQRALELSRQMTDGEKFNIFVLELSFFGWMFLGALVIIGGFFVQPYVNATFAELYAALRAKAFSTGMSNEEELSGFLQY